MRKIRLTLSDNLGGYQQEVSEIINMHQYNMMLDNTNVLNELLSKLEMQMNHAMDPNVNETEL